MQNVRLGIPESLAHVLGRYSSLAQTKYMERLSASLKLLFFAMLRDLKLADSVPPWYAWVELKSLYVGGQSKELDVEMSKICGAPSSDILKRM